MIGSSPYTFTPSDNSAATVAATINSQYGNMVNATAGNLVAHGATATQATAQAQGMVFGMVQRQAAMLAFLDNFKLLGVIFFAIIPIFFLMQRPKMSGGSVPVH